MIITLDTYMETETNETKIGYTEKEYISDIDGFKEFSLLKYDDENTISINTTENGKHTGHMEVENNPYINELFKMETNDIKVDGPEMQETIIKCIKTETGYL